MHQDENTAILSRSFGVVANDYDRLRSGPSAAALDWLLPAAASDVLEIGAGTGILTRLLAERVGHLTAVEPDERIGPSWPRPSRASRCWPVKRRRSPPAPRRSTS